MEIGEVATYADFSDVCAFEVKAGETYEAICPKCAEPYRYDHSKPNGAATICCDGHFLERRKRGEA